MSSEGLGRSQIDCCCNSEREGFAPLLLASCFAGVQIRRSSFRASLVSTCSRDTLQDTFKLKLCQLEAPSCDP